MKTRTFVMILLILNTATTFSQSRPSTVDQALEGGKILVELFKVLGTDKARESRDGEHAGCEGGYADLCIVNAKDTSLIVVLVHRESNKRCELVITPEGRECCLQLSIGVWTYDIGIRGGLSAIRKGDLLMEACNDVTMTLK